MHKKRIILVIENLDEILPFGTFTCKIKFEILPLIVIIWQALFVSLSVCLSVCYTLVGNNGFCVDL